MNAGMTARALPITSVTAALQHAQNDAVLAVMPWHSAAHDWLPC